jgi:hypothetical protein
MHKLIYCIFNLLQFLPVLRGCTGSTTSERLKFVVGNNRRAAASVQQSLTQHRNDQEQHYCISHHYLLRLFSHALGSELRSELSTRVEHQN